MARRTKKNQKIIRYRKPLHINVGLIIFFFIFVYLIFSVYIYMTKKKVQVYEVHAGSIVEDKSYTGMIFREEELMVTDRAGYISYYIREGKKSSVGMTVYGIDETGKMSEILAANQSEGFLSDESLADLKRQLTALSVGYQSDRFDAIYESKYHLEASILEMGTQNSLSEIEALLAGNGISFQQVRAGASGVVAFTYDGYEGYTPEMVRADFFEKENYTKSYLKSGDLIGVSDPAYRLVTNDNWSLLALLSAEDVAYYQQRETSQLNITFPDRNITVAAGFSIIYGADGNAYGKFDINRYMVQFISDRFVEFEIAEDKLEGLKIPVSSIVTKSFYTVPVDYLTTGGDSKRSGFTKKVFSEIGAYTLEFVPVTLYYSTEEVYYIDSEQLPGGTIIQKPDSQEEYVLGPMEALQGVYNINRGYAVFRQIDILASNEEYCIVRKNMNYGLSIYDHIVLDGTKVDENELMY